MKISYQEVSYQWKTAVAVCLTQHQRKPCLASQGSTLSIDTSERVNWNKPDKYNWHETQSFLVCQNWERTIHHTVWKLRSYITNWQRTQFPSSLVSYVAYTIAPINTLFKMSFWNQQPAKTRLLLIFLLDPKASCQLKGLDAYEVLYSWKGARDWDDRLTESRIYMRGREIWMFCKWGIVVARERRKVLSILQMLAVVFGWSNTRFGRWITGYV